jgi:alpha,alpha-trehalase
MKSKKEIQDSCSRYIQKYWKQITFSHPKDKQMHFGLPNRYVSPNHNIFRNDQFYWDTYFTILGLVRNGQEKLAKGMVDNLVFMFDRFGLIPMRNRFYNVGTSQAPFLTSMALEVAEALPDDNWLAAVMSTAEAELQQYWTNEMLTEKHISYKGLSRYCDHFITHLGAEHESGWDMTSRFNDRCLDYLPVDLNSCLYKYESDLADFYASIGKVGKSRVYTKKAAIRKRCMNKLMWSKKKNFYFDYNKLKKKRGNFFSIAGFYPMWAGIASKKQAELIVSEVLPLFEHDGGLVNTLPQRLASDFKQHDFPNGWPHQQWIVICGLLKYGYADAAERIAHKWLSLNEEIFAMTGKMWEKYNVVAKEIGKFNSERYPTQWGFAWTNSVYLRLRCDFPNKNSED